MLFMEHSPQAMAAVERLEEQQSQALVFEVLVMARNRQAGPHDWHDSMPTEILKVAEPKQFALQAEAVDEYFNRLTTGEYALDPDIFWENLFRNPNGILKDALRWHYIFNQLDKERKNEIRRGAA